MSISFTESKNKNKTRRVFFLFLVRVQGDRAPWAPLQ